MEQYFELLGLSKNSSKDEVKKAFRTILKEIHPDKNQDRSDLFKKIMEDKSKEYNDAYEKIMEYFDHIDEANSHETNKNEQNGTAKRKEQTKNAKTYNTNNAHGTISITILKIPDLILKNYKKYIFGVRLHKDDHSIAYYQNDFHKYKIDKYGVTFYLYQIKINPDNSYFPQKDKYLGFSGNYNIDLTIWESITKNHIISGYGEDIWIDVNKSNNLSYDSLLIL